MKIFFAVLIIFIIPLGVLGQTVDFYSRDLLQGDTFVASVFGKIPIEADFAGNPASIFTYRDHYKIIFGIDSNKNPGKYILRIKFSDGATMEDYINVKRRKFAVVQLGIPEKLELTPKSLIKELGVIKKSLAPTLGAISPQIFFDKSFGLPLADNRKITSYFGEIRKTGSESIRHLGIDFGAILGKYVYVINGGVVSRAYEDKIYGKSVVVDHGAGIYSLYLHLDKILAREGQRLFKGDILGTVGQSGYATSPHLHFSIKIRGVSVDPIRFVNAFANY